MKSDPKGATGGANGQGAGPTTRQFLLAAVLISIAAGGTGALFGARPSLLNYQSTRREPVPSVEQPAAKATPPFALYDLPPIVTNLGAPVDTWIRLEASMIYDPKVVQFPETMGVTIGDDLLAYLRTTTLAQLEGATGLHNLREDLNERASIRSDGKIKELLLKTLVVQ